MLIEEIIRSCANERVAQAAVASIGPKFTRAVAAAAEACDMSIGGFTSRSVERFARHGDEADMRAVLASMQRSQEPILAGLHRILAITLAAGERRHVARSTIMPAEVCAWQLELRRERHYA